MTGQDVFQHWQKGARDAFEMAQHAQETKKFELCLFHCHLAIEKALKALHIQQKDEAPPKSHDLTHLAGQLSHSLDKQQVSLMKELNQFCIEARYSDPQWAETHATSERTNQWLNATGAILSQLLP
jgi:HEPN domain-containing protein